MNLAAVLCPWSLSWRSRLSWCTLLYLTSLRIPFRNLPYLDMIMLDYPAGDCDSIRGQWAAFEAMLAAKKTKSLAVSNFSPDQIKCLSAANTTGNVTDPAVNQMQYSVGSGSSTVVSDDTALGGIVTQAYSPLGSGSLIDDPDCTRIGKPYNKSSAQVALRWIVQRGAVFTTEASSLVHFQQDLDIFDFALSAADMEVLNKKTLARRTLLEEA
eukprot:m.105906 g.105906  ORF g.105906 m.105906 type:complete len:213 (-) comp16881_c0_seq21:2622-3260(-)